jgi:hypothetical protein
MFRSQCFDINQATPTDHQMNASARSNSPPKGGRGVGRAEGSFQLHVHVDVVTLASALGFVPSHGHRRRRPARRRIVRITRR